MTICVTVQDLLNYCQTCLPGDPAKVYLQIDTQAGRQQIKNVYFDQDDDMPILVFEDRP
jgi:hypothetical protein